MLPSIASAVTDQTFSTANYKLIWDEENRRGRKLDSRLPALAPHNAALRALTAERRETLAPLALHSDLRRDTLVKFTDRRATLLTARRVTILDAVEKWSLETGERIDTGNYGLPLTSVGIRNQKPAFKISFANAADFFLVKQLERNVVNAFQISMTDRHKMVTQLNVLLRDQSPKTLLKADIASYFESVPHDKLLAHLDARRALSRTSMQFIHQLLSDYRDLTGAVGGLPRGVGLSSFLAEAYLQDLDLVVRALPGVTFYSRYVDDMVVLSSRKRHEDTGDLVSPALRKELQSKGLSLNKAKTRRFSTNDPQKYRLIPLLGYEFRVSLRTGAVTLDMSQRRFTRYSERLKMSFDTHARSAHLGEGAHTALISRVRLLTGNYRGAKPSGKTMMGVSFSNRALTEVSPRLSKLDSLLRAHIKSAELPEHAAKKLAGYAFSSGFETTRFERFRAGRVQDLGVIWKYGPNQD